MALTRRERLWIALERAQASARRLASRRASAPDRAILRDPLTNLPNAALLRDRLAQAIAFGRREGAPVGVLRLDLDALREINDAYGHAAGDRVLMQVAERLRFAVREVDSVARLGGDEFVVVLPGADLAGASRVAESLLAVTELPFAMGEESVGVRASIGVAVSPEHGDDAESLLRHADAAMSAAKRSGGGYAIFSIALERSGATRLALLAALRGAAERGELLLHYQPEVDLQSGAVSGLEALVRWRHPRLGLLPPRAFIGLAEETGLIKPITKWVIAASLDACRAWHEAGLDVPVSVNLSMRNLLDPELPGAVGTLLARSGAPGEWLGVEITESAVMSDPARVTETLSRLRSMRVRISVDDFGTGYSSLTYLHRLAVDEVKIDQSFVQSMLSDRGSATIVRATVDLGHDLGCRVVAEGVELAEAWARLAALRCDAAQGSYVSLPMPAEDLMPWLARAGREMATPVVIVPLPRTEDW